MGWFNFEDQLAAYGQYHTNPWNRAIHVACVPLIFWSFLVWIAKLPILILLERFPFNTSFAIVFLYIFYYLLLEPVAGAIFAPFLLTLTYSANVFALKHPLSMQISIGIHVIAWVLQLLGHAFLERRAPAFFDNIAQAFLLAPLFIFMELLFLVGYRPALQRRVKQNVENHVNVLKDKKTE